MKARVLIWVLVLCVLSSFAYADITISLEDFDGVSLEKVYTLTGNVSLDADVVVFLRFYLPLADNNLSSYSSVIFGWKDRNLVQILYQTITWSLISYLQGLRVRKWSKY